ncbi:MAG: type II secretion system secretin GspD [Xanthomonadales bacterium]|nr:type II secretion system secretin GspD [Xanthomonadales bacterium]
MTVGRTHQPWRRLLVTTAAALLCSASLSAQQQPVYVSDPASGNQVAGHTLNLRDADISSLIATVSEITGRNFIIDPRVTGKVNVISNRPMSADEVYDVFLSVLRVNGFAAVGAGNIIKIVPEALATQDAPASPGASAPDALVTRIVPVNHLSPAELVQLLRPLVPQSAQLLPHPTSSTLLIADRAANVDRIQQLIARLDQASASEVEVVPLEHANAAEVVRTLTLLQPPSATDGSGNKLAADERTNSILIAGDRSKRLRLKALIAHLDTPLSGSETLQVIYLRYADAEQLVPILETALATFGGKQPGSEDDRSKPAIQAHKETNSLVINAPPAVFRDLKDVVRQLDIRRAQVLIEALVAEVSDNIAREIGIQWQATDNDFGDNGVLGGTNFPGANGTGGIIGASIDPSVLGGQAGLNLGWIRGTVNVPGVGEILQIGALARALAADSATNVLSTPSTMTLDHQEATLSVGQEVPFLTGSFATGSSSTNENGIVNPFQTIDRREVGLKLKVTPHINEGDSVVLDIDLEVSSLAPANQQGAVDLITNTSALTTRVLVRDRAMLVLGGLTSEQLTDSVQKVPGLGSIPVVGNLFKYRASNKERRSLMIFLTPSIARDSATEALISSEKYNYLRTEQLRAREQNSGLLPDEVTPLLPEMQDFLRQGLPQGEPMASEGGEGYQ